MTEIPIPFCGVRMIFLFGEHHNMTWPVQAAVTAGQMNMTRGMQIFFTPVIFI
jgi:hypothetical protein